MDFDYIKIVSWHVVKTATRVPDRYITRCGRRVEGTVVDTIPGGEKSCESCLRFSMGDIEKA